MEYGAVYGGLVALTTPAAASPRSVGDLDLIETSATLNKPEPIQASGAGAPTSTHNELRHAIEQLTHERQEQLTALIEQTRRCDELAEALPTDAGRGLDPQRQQLRDAVLELLMGWQALGGTVALAPPAHTAAPVAAAGLPLAAPPTTAPAPPEPRVPPLTQPPRFSEPLHRPAEPRMVTGPHPPGESLEPSSDWDEDLAALLTGLGTSPNAQDEMDAIQRAASASFSRWVHYPRSVQRALVGNLACRLRYLQDHLGVTGSKLDSAFRSLTRFSKSFQPGWVNGLTRGRGPAAESWTEEARVWWDQLAMSAAPEDETLDAPSEPASIGHDEALDAVRTWLGEWRDAPDVAKPMCLEKTLDAVQAALEAGVTHTDSALCRLADEIYAHLELARFRRLRQGIRDLELADREDQGIEPAEAVPSDWPWWSHTVGRRAVLLGAEDDAQRQGVVESAFGLAELRCLAFEPGDTSDETIHALLGGGNIDLVILVSETPGEAHLRAVIRACQVRGLTWVHVSHSLGVTRVRMAVERFLQPDPRGETGGH